MYTSKLFYYDPPLRHILTLGGGRKLDYIPSLFVELSDGEHTETGSCVVSPLWVGGLGHLTLLEGIEIFKHYMGALLRYALSLLNQTVDRLSDFESIQNKILEGPVDQWFYPALPPHMRMSCASAILNALLGLVARQQKMSVLDLLIKHFDAGDVLSAEPVFEKYEPFLTISLGADDATVRQDIEAFGEPTVVKFKVGGTQIPAAEVLQIKAYMRMFSRPPLMILDGNQALMPGEFQEILHALDDENLLERLLAVEQICPVGREPRGWNHLFAPFGKINIFWDESIFGSDDLERVGKLITEPYAGNGYFVSKSEKCGFGTTPALLKTAAKYGIGVTPATLTGNPQQLPMYTHVYSHMPSVLALPDSRNVLRMEANGFQYYPWPVYCNALLDHPQSEIFQASVSPMTILQHPEVRGWPWETETKSLAQIAGMEKLFEG